MTNPVKESNEYVESISDVVAGFSENHYSFSDYFEQIYSYAEALIRDGKAYVCSSTRSKFAHARHLNAAW